jgi:hypothetical protein
MELQVPESAVDEVEVGRWRYEVVVNTGGYSAFGLRQGPSIDAPRTGEVAINGEKVVIVERRRCDGWVYLRREQGGWLAERNLQNDVEICRQDVDLQRHPSAKDTVAERATWRGRW